MSTTKFIIFSSVLCVVLGNFNVRDDVPWFKARQRIKDRFMGGLLRGRNSICQANRQGNVVQGVCVPLKECFLMRGTSGGTCNLLGTCCIVERTCFNTTSAKLSYFVNPTAFQPNCGLTVNLFSTDVCQIRLDFERFSIAGPTQLDPVGNSSYQCNLDSFTVTNPLSGNNLGFPGLCGINDGQHIYLSVNNTRGANSVSLNFRLTNRNTTNTVTVAPTWRIRITQLECTTSTIDFNNIQTALVTMYQKFKNKKNNNANTDAALIAPAGCLQYYTERTGTYESFNFGFNNTQGNYIGNLNYAICFRRTFDVCGIRHTSDFFYMNFNPTETSSLLRCNLPTGSQDYISIPGGSRNNVSQEVYCNQDLPSNTQVISTSPGPLFVGVHTDNVRAYEILEKGFRINYEILSTGSC